MDNVKEKVDTTIITVSEYIEKLSKRNVDKVNGTCISELTKALATLILARALGEKFTN